MSLHYSLLEEYMDLLCAALCYCRPVTLALPLISWFFSEWTFRGLLYFSKVSVCCLCWNSCCVFMSWLCSASVYVLWIWLCMLLVVLLLVLPANICSNAAVFHSCAAFAMGKKCECMPCCGRASFLNCCLAHALWRCGAWCRFLKWWKPYECFRPRLVFHCIALQIVVFSSLLPHCNLFWSSG